MKKKSERCPESVVFVEAVQYSVTGRRSLATSIDEADLHLAVIQSENLTLTLSQKEWHLFESSRDR